MCLEIHSDKQFDLFGDKDEVVCYKVLLRSKGVLSSPYRSEDYPTSGTIVSNRKSVHLTEEEIQDNAVKYGIHVLTDRPGCEEERCYWISVCERTKSIGEVFLYALRCRKEDLVVTGSFVNLRAAVFTQVEIIGEVEVSDVPVN